MRKPRDFDAALKTLTDKTKALKENKRRQLGELIVATGADALDMETLAGGLLAMVETNDAAAEGELAQARRCVLSGNSPASCAQTSWQQQRALRRAIAAQPSA